MADRRIENFSYSRNMDNGRVSSNYHNQDFMDLPPVHNQSRRHYLKNTNIEADMLHRHNRHQQVLGTITLLHTKYKSLVRWLISSSDMIYDVNLGVSKIHIIE